VPAKGMQASLLVPGYGPRELRTLHLARDAMNPARPPPPAYPEACSSLSICSAGKRRFRSPPASLFRIESRKKSRGTLDRSCFRLYHRTNPLKIRSRGSMELIPAETSLVVAGAWNAAILTPPWVLRHAFHKPPQDQPQVQVFLPAGAGLIFELPRYALEGVTYSVRPDALVFAPNSSDDDSLGKVETASANIVEVLSHTPLSGIGHNFGFRDMEAVPAHGAVFSQSRQDLADAMPEGWQATAAAVVSSFKNANETVHVVVRQGFETPGCACSGGQG
jgi:hypothetical protein